jgi:NAD+ diphosphatase
MSTHQMHYGGGPLDRAGHRRKDEQWIQAQLEQNGTRFIPVWRGSSLMQIGKPGRSTSEPRICSRSEIGKVMDLSVQTTFLGMGHRTPYFAVDLSNGVEENVADQLNGIFVDLRLAGQHMEPENAALLAYARGMLHWHRSHQYCSQCGTKSESRNGGHMRACPEANCARETYPRTDPAVIMLVEHIPADGGAPVCLMGSHRRLPTRVFSTLAGFVEPGESLEEAVTREVLEEVNVIVDDVRYEASQPWPFPSSIMLGFYARAVTTDIEVDDDELSSARWFTSEEIRAAGDWGDDSADIQLPRKDSIARHLINTWLERQP